MRRNECVPINSRIVRSSGSTWLQQIIAGAKHWSPVITFKTDSSTLRSHQAVGMLGTQDVMMEVGYPLTAGNRHI